MGIHSFRSLVVIGGILWIAFVVEVTQFIEYSRNVLLTNGQWVSSKHLLQMYVMGSEQFMTTRNALFRNRLHLGEWHGFNEVSLKEPVEPAAIEYRFKLSRGAYLYFIFNRSESGHYSIRLSRNAQFPSMFYQADRVNKFVSRTVLDLTPGRLGDGWHNLVLSFGSGQGDCEPGWSGARFYAGEDRGASSHRIARGIPACGPGLCAHHGKGWPHAS